MSDTLVSLSGLFDQIDLTSPGCPVRISCVVPNNCAFERWPAFPIAARPENGRVANGRGMSDNLCRNSGLGEAVELASCCAWGNEDIFSASIQSLPAPALTPELLNGFPSSSIDERRDWNMHYGSYDWRPANWPDGQRIAWVHAIHAVTENLYCVPADFVLIGRREPGDEEAVAIADSNGCASGLDQNAAKLAALLELVERDATGRWWYGRRGRPGVSYEILEDWPELVQYLGERTRVSFMFDITTDLGVPCIASVSSEPDGSGVAIGFAADLDCAQAACSAVAEMIQIEGSIRLATIGNEATPTNWSKWLSNVSISTPPLQPPTELLRPRSQKISDAENALAICLEACERNECPIFFIDLTRPQFRVPTFRALSPTLCHFKPRFDRPRLLAHDPRDSDRMPGSRDDINLIPLII